MYGEIKSRKFIIMIMDISWIFMNVLPTPYVSATSHNEMYVTGTNRCQYVQRYFSAVCFNDRCHILIKYIVNYFFVNRVCYNNYTYFGDKRDYLSPPTIHYCNAQLGFSVDTQWRKIHIINNSLVAWLHSVRYIGTTVRLVLTARSIRHYASSNA